VDDGSNDHTFGIAKDAGLVVFRHEENRVYGANQKTCYKQALMRGLILL